MFQIKYVVILAVLSVAIGEPPDRALAALSGAIYTTNNTGSIVNQNIFGPTTAVYLGGGPQNQNLPGLPSGTYYFQVTDPSGKVLLSSDNAVCRQLTVTAGRVGGASSASGSCKHANGTLNPVTGVIPVQLAPFSATANNGGEYKVWLIAQATSTSISSTDPKVIVFAQSDSKTDNFKVLQVTPSDPPPVGSCQPSSSLSLLVNGTNVTSYVPKGDWETGTTGVSVVNVEGTSIIPTLIPTASIVNSCASNSITGQTVCAGNDAKVYLFSGTGVSATLTSAGSGTISFSGGNCTNCSVAMDATHNKAVIGLSLAGVPGFQFLNLGSSPAFESPFTSPSTAISEDPLIDPIRNLLLSAAENGTYEIVNIATSTSPGFFENLTGGGMLNSSGEDCTTGIALAPAEFTSPSSIFIADMTQAIFTPGNPGNWSAPSQNQFLSESVLPAAGPSGMAIAQGTHIGIVSDEFGGDAFTAIALPATSGSGTPAITDWVTCGIGNGFVIGDDPHTVTAYQSPNGGHAIAVLANYGASTLAVVDLTQTLNSTVVPRTAGGHACASLTLPSSVVRLISVP